MKVKLYKYIKGLNSINDYKNECLLFECDNFDDSIERADFFADSLIEGIITFEDGEDEYESISYPKPELWVKK